MPGTERSAVTAAALVDAAEAEFAATGFERASLRAVMRSAGADPGAVHYHFGGRPALAAAVLDRILRPLNERRVELLDVALVEATGASGPTVPTLVDALVRPDVEAAVELRARSDAAVDRSRLLGAIYLDPAAFVIEQVEAHFRPVAGRFLPRLVAALPDHDVEVLSWRIRWVLFGTLGAVLSGPPEPAPLSPDVLLDRLVTSLAAAIAAPTE
ncbi:MAG: TetR/AcrR family transcriptional regulator [Actinomycetota bacterium]